MDKNLYTIRSISVILIDLLKNLCMNIEHQWSCLLLSTVGDNNISGLKMKNNCCKS